VTDSRATICVVDDDESVRKSLARLLAAAGYRVETYASGAALLAREPLDGPACAVLDLAMPGLDGLTLQSSLASANRNLEIVFLTGHGEVASSVQAMKGGATDFLTKPVDEADLLRAVSEAVERHGLACSTQRTLEDARGRFASLSPREREVLTLVVTGLRNKQIAGELGIAEKTVKVHRARVMEKADVRSLAELVQVWSVARSADNPDSG
jgi:FixJ family two-component response regulator